MFQIKDQGKEKDMADKENKVEQTTTPKQDQNGARSGSNNFWQNVRVPDLVKHRIEVVKQQKKLGKRFRYFLRRILPIILIAGLAFTIWSNETLLNVFLQLLSFIGQLLFAILFMVVQFGSLFWFPFSF